MEETLTHLNEAVEFIKSIAPDVWAIYVKQQVIDGLVTLLGLPILGVGVAAMVRLTRWEKSKGRKTRYEWDMPVWQGLAIATVCVAVLFLVVGSLALHYGLTHLLNPEYYAIKELLP